MRTLPFLRRSNGVRTEPLNLTAAAPAPGASRSDASATPPVPSRHPASALPVVPDHPAAGSRPASVPYDPTPLSTPLNKPCAGSSSHAAAPVPGAGGRFAPAGAAVRGDRAPAPSPGGEAARPVAAVAPMSLLPKASCVPGGTGGRSLVADAGRAPRAVGHDADRRRPRQIPRTPRCPVPGRGH